MKLIDFVCQIITSVTISLIIYSSLLNCMEISKYSFGGNLLLLMTMISSTWICWKLSNIIDIEERKKISNDSKNIKSPDHQRS